MKKLAFSLVAAGLIASGLNAAEFALDKSHTSVNFKIKHMQISKVRGNFKEFDAAKIDFDVDAKKLNAIEASVKTASINTDNDKRDEHLKAPDFFDSAKFADMTFVSKSVNGDKIVGDLTLKGVTKEVEFEFDFGGITQVEGKDKIGFTLEGEINRVDFGVGEAGAMLDSEVDITIEVEALAK